MWGKGFLVESAQLEILVPPANYSATATTGLWVNMALWKRLHIAIITGAWAAGTAAVTLNAASDNAGTNSTALPFDTVYISSGTGNSQSADGLVTTAVVSNTFNIANQASTIYVIEVRDTMLLTLNTTAGIGGATVTKTFTHVQVAIASPGSNADYYAVYGVCYDGDYCAKPEDLPTAVTN